MMNYINFHKIGMNFLDNINNFFKIQIEKSYKMIINNYKIVNL